MYGKDFILSIYLKDIMWVVRYGRYMFEGFHAGSYLWQIYICEGFHVDSYMAGILCEGFHLDSTISQIYIGRISCGLFDMADIYVKDFMCGVIYGRYICEKFHVRSYIWQIYMWRISCVYMADIYVKDCLWVVIYGRCV